MESLGWKILLGFALIGWAIGATWRDPPISLIAAAWIVGTVACATGLLDHIRSRSGGKLPFVAAWRIRRNKIGGFGFEADSLFPMLRLVPLQHAAQLAYNETRRGVVSQVLDRLDRLGLEDMANAVTMADNTPLYGYREPFAVRELIPDEFIKTGRFSSDGSEVYDQFDKEKRYKGLLMRRRDMKRNLKQMKKVWGLIVKKT